MAMTDEEADRISRELGLGAEGTHSHGRLGEEDEGDLKAAITVKDGKLVILFGKKVGWLAMTPAQALALAHAIMGRVLTMPK